MFSQVIVTHIGALLPWEWLNTCWPVGRGELTPRFAFLAYAASALPSLPQPKSFLTFLTFSPIPVQGEEERANSCGDISCWLGLNHDKGQSKLSACTSGVKDQICSLNDSPVTGQQLNTLWLGAGFMSRFSRRKGLFRNLVLTKEWMGKFSL